MLFLAAEVILSLDEATTVIGEGDQRVRVQLALVGTADFEISASISTRSTDGPGKDGVGKLPLSLTHSLTHSLPPSLSLSLSLTLSLSPSLFLSQELPHQKRTTV